jgi:hypothetical protein
MRSTRAPLWTLTALALLSAAPAGAQLSQYTAPGSLLDRGTSKREQMDLAIENARWRVGPLRLAPWLTVRDAAYVSDVFAGTLGSTGGPAGPAAKEEPDFTITAGAGLQGYLPLGRKSFFTVDVLPQYVYWQKQDERRRLNGYYGVGLLGFFNRLTLQAIARRAEEQAVITPEFEQRVHTRQDLLDALIELRVARSVYLFASASGLDFQTLVKDLGDDPRLPPFEQLDREERVLRAGLEVRFEERLRVGAGVERSKVDFLDAVRDRSYSDTAPLLEASYGNERMRLSGALAFRSLEPAEGSELAPVDVTTGRLQATWIPRWRLSYSLYGSRGLTYSLEPGYSYFLADRLGATVGARLGKASAIDLFFETGVHDYTRTGPEVLPRQDDFSAYGTTLHLQIRDRVRFNVGVSRTELDSDIAGRRGLTTFQSGLEISAFGGALTIR